MRATSNQIALLAKERGKTIVFFPVRGEPHSCSPFALQKKYGVGELLNFDVAAFEIHVRESANPIAPKPVAA